MTNQLALIEKKLHDKDVTNRLTVALNLDPKDETAIRKASKYVDSVLSEIRKSASDPKKDLTGCHPDSIIGSMIDAARLELTIDGQQHGYLVKYGNNATFQIGYRAYLYKIKKYYPDADFTVELIFNGDEVNIWSDNGVDQFTFKKGDPFNHNQANFKGVLFAVTYTDNGRLVRKVTAVPKERIDRARKAAKQDFIWGSDYFEKAKGAAIKNAAKHMFASIQGLQDVIRFDNEDYDPEKQPATPVRKSIVDNINAAVTGVEPEPEYMEAEYEEIVEPDPLVSQGPVEAAKGVESYTKWLKAIPEDKKDIVRPHNAAWTKIAKEATAAMIDEDEPVI